MHRTWSKEEENRLKTLYEEGYTARNIAKILNDEFHQGIEKRNHASVKTKARRLGNVKSRFSSKEVNGLYYCSHCRTYKEKHEFRKNRSNTGGISALCKPCESAYRNQLRLQKKYGEIWEKFNNIKSNNENER